MNEKNFFTQLGIKNPNKNQTGESKQARFTKLADEHLAKISGGWTLSDGNITYTDERIIKRFYGSALEGTDW